MKYIIYKYEYYTKASNLEYTQQLYTQHREPFEKLIPIPKNTPRRK